MAHGDYNCCAVCDKKMAFSYYAVTKEEICSGCAVNLAKLGIFVRNREELLTWMRGNPAGIVLAVLHSVGFSKCYYQNEVDEVFEALEKVANA